MTITEAVVVVFVIAAATVAAILNHLTPELGAILGLAIGYAGAKVGPTVIASGKAPEAPWKGTDE